MNANEQLVHALTHLVHELREDREQRKQDNVILNRMAEMECRIMEAIVNFSNRVNAIFDVISTGVDEIVASQTGIAGDVAELKRIIVALQNNPGTLTPEDQALLDSAEAKANALVSKTAAVSEALKALDAATENVPAPNP